MRLVQGLCWTRRRKGKRWEVSIKGAFPKRKVEFPKGLILMKNKGAYA